MSSTDCDQRKEKNSAFIEVSLFCGISPKTDSSSNYCNCEMYKMIWLFYQVSPRDRGSNLIKSLLSGMESRVGASEG